MTSAHAWGRLASDRRARIAAAVLAAVLIAAVLAPWLSPFDPAAQTDLASRKLMAPSWTHLMGTDVFARDVLSRLMHGARVSLGVALGAMLLSATLGTAFGTLAALMGGVTDWIVTALVDVLIALPRLLVVAALVATFGSLSPVWLVILLGGSGWLATARIVRAELRDHRRREYVLAARALGASNARIVWRHLIPAVAPQIALAAALAFAAVIPLEAGLSLVGLGVQAPMPSWGNILLDGTEYLTSAWWLIVFPGAAITITVGAALVLADRLRAAIAGREEAA